MSQRSQNEPTIFVIFGASGDLTQRKVVPALFNLFMDRWLSEPVAVIGFGRTSFTDEGFPLRMRQGVGRYSRRGKASDRDWEKFAAHLSYLSADYEDPRAYCALSDQISKLEKEWHTTANRVFYLATPPEEFEVIAQQLGRASLSNDRGRVRLVLEKPFGRDLTSARALNHAFTSVFDESQIYRIDHYLGKETVQNIMALRFANAIFEPIWNRRYIDQVQITVAEELGVEHRGNYYDTAGALRDMAQNHLLQILSLIAMEPPVPFTADEIRNKKVDVLHAIRSIPPGQLDSLAVRGQYGAGWINGQRVPPYREEPGVASNSYTETYAGLKLFVDNWRWQDVPFYLRTGKRLHRKASEVSIQFRPVPHRSFPAIVLMDFQPNRLVIRIQPDEGILLRFQAKQPGLTMHLRPVDMEFTYQEAFPTPSPEAYEALLLDVMQGDGTQFVRADEVEAAWSVVAPILDAWAAGEPLDFPNYAASSWGPTEAEALLDRDGRSWFLPNISEDDEEGQGQEKEQESG